MSCPWAMRLFLAVGVCAVAGGCAASAIQTTTVPVDSRVASSTPTHVIEADNNVSLTRPVSVEDILGWSIRGTSDDIIIDRIQHSSNALHLSPSQEIHLHDAGVSDEVIRAMKATAG